MLFVSGLHLFWMPSPPELTVSSPFHGCYSFVRIYQSLAIPFLRDSFYCAYTRFWEIGFSCGNGRPQEIFRMLAVITEKCGHLMLARAHLPSPDLVSIFFHYFTHFLVSQSPVLELLALLFWCSYMMKIFSPQLLPFHVFILDMQIYFLYANLLKNVSVYE